MNKVILSGNSTRDLEIIKSGNTNIGKFTIAVTRTHKNEEGIYDTDFLDCVVFNPLEYVEKNLKKGCRLLVEGSIQKTARDDKNGNKVWFTNINVSNVEIYKMPTAKSKEEKNPFEEFGEHFTTEWEAGQQIEISDSDLPF